MIKCYFDGCCEPKNPYGNMGIGSIIIKDNIEVWSHSNFIPQSQNNSNNVAEYLALEQILIWLKENEVPENTIFIFGDSQLVVNQMNGNWRIKQGLYKPHALRCKELISKLDKVLVIRWIGREGNQVADDLSKKHLIENNIEFNLQPQND